MLARTRASVEASQNVELTQWYMRESSVVHRTNVVKWLYIADLFPNGFLKRFEAGPYIAGPTACPAWPHSEQPRLVSAMK